MTQARDLADGKFDTSTLVVDAANNRVGIGLTAPDQLLHVRNASGNCVAVIGQYGTGTKATVTAAANVVELKADNGTDDAISLKTGSTERMRVDTSVKFDNLAGLTTNGNVTITPNGTGIFVPKKVPSFYAYGNAVQTIADQTWTRVNLQSTLFDTCSNFNTSNYRFTAPVNGIYSFTTALNFGTNTVASGYVYADVLKTTAGGVQSQYYTMGMRLDGQVISNDTQINGSILLPLGQNDYVQMGAYQDVASGSATLNGGRCYFTGHLVSGT